MRHFLLIITVDLYVYQIPMDTVNGTLDKLYLGHYKAESIEEKWPKLGADSRYQYLKKNRGALLDVWTAVDPFDEYVNFETDYNRNRKYAVLYGIHLQTVTTGGTYAPTGDHLAFLSSTNLSSFYQLTLNNKLYQKHLTIERWFFWQRDVKNACRHHGQTAKYYSKTYRRLCTSGHDQIYIQHPNQTSPPCKAVDWPVLTGFVANSQFYLFGKSYIFSFSESSYDTPGEPVSLRKIPYADFIQCGGASQARALGVSKKSPVQYGLIVAIILIIVLLCLCCILCLMREAMEERKRKKKKGVKSDAGGSSWNPFSKGGGGRGSAGQRSFRSSGLPGFGFLTGKKPSKRSAQGSKRSKGGLDPAKSLSRKGGPATKRSVGAEPGRSLSNKAGPGTRRSTGVSIPNPVTGASAPGTKRSANGVGSGKGILGKPAGGRSSSKKGVGPSGAPSGGRNAPLIGGSTGRSGTNNVTGRSKGMASFGGTNPRKGSSRSAHSARATERSGMKKSRR